MKTLNQEPLELPNVFTRIQNKPVDELVTDLPVFQWCGEVAEGALDRVNGYSEHRRYFEAFNYPTTRRSSSILEAIIVYHRAHRGYMRLSGNFQ